MGKSLILLALPAILNGILLGGNGGSGGSGGGGEVPFGEVRDGNATYYLSADGTGNCMLDALPEPQYVGALGNLDYDSPVIDGHTYANATLCGAHARVTGTKGSVVIRIVDRCPDAICTRGHIDLSPEAFAAIDDPILGYVPIRWQLVSAPVEGPVHFRYKDGSNPWWMGIQVSNIRNPVARLEVLQGGTWSSLPRAQYNYFIDDTGLGVGYHTFRITDVFGHQLVETSTVYLDGEMPETDWVGKGQFPPP